MAIDFSSAGKEFCWTELANPTRRAELRGHELLTPDREHRLHIRNGQTPHFFCLTRILKRDISRRERDPAHIARVRKLLGDLQTDNNFTVGFYDWPNNANKSEPNYIDFAKARDYIWEDEVTRSLSHASNCRFDILGQSRRLNLTDKSPLIAIEVIKHSFPSNQTFSAQLAFTKIQPCVILFDVVDKYNYFLKVEDDKKRIRAIFYIYDGSVWKNGNRQNIHDANLYKESIMEMMRGIPSQKPHGPTRDF